MTDQQTGPEILRVSGLTVTFPSGDGPVRAVRGVDYTLHRGEVLGIVGESGSGKSVTSLAVMGLLPPTAQVEGTIRFDGVDLLAASEDELTRVRGERIAMIFQDPMTSLNPVYTVGYQIAEAVLAHRDVSKAAARERAIELLGTVRIPNPDQRVDSYPHELSGGMRQRVVIAIAMANDPDVIIADEPTTALDVTVQAQVMEALAAAQRATGAAMVLITHDLGVIAGQADRVMVMYAGKPVEVGGVEDIFYTPRMPYTLGLLGSLPRLDRPAERLTPIPGSPPSVVNMPPGCPFTPRCPLSSEVCREVEPELVGVEDAAGTSGDGHRAACHHSSQLAGAAAGEVFDAGGGEDLTGHGAAPADPTALTGEAGR
ncbi:peptide/nickel transport system ATP-binding protein/peptide/nickel transport system ATP-binding protein [Pseudonocardia ammonioxydans]|uniref:Peptide/nickel transport system ATP-binding protein/peptide/nickel transport system ATP-binding protein n=1 Tax=Pseudonocardia ammonioxydans TaxID=260086 RepID=A0A1I4V3K7_PSUAM|nr:ABC transporter ATP-binding protein [Pseudonocardia ammonioxydans]SFM95776.1 peptide/nickel transport system ATP-binding protein/peptide/nickel transport system ATP-binding protein [Pseudonocardia ammonioxydans]